MTRSFNMAQEIRNIIKKNPMVTGPELLALVSEALTSVSVNAPGILKVTMGTVVLVWFNVVVSSDNAIITGIDGIVLNPRILSVPSS